METRSDTTPDARIVAESRLRVGSTVYARSFGAEVVLLEFGRGEYFGLDEIGAEIWRRIEAGDALGAIADEIATRYEVEREVALRDIFELASALLAHGLVTLPSPASG